MATLGPPCSWSSADRADARRAGCSNARGGRSAPATLARILVIFSAAHLLVPAGIVFLILLLRYDLYRADRHPKRAYLLLAVAGLFAATWIVLTFTSPDILHSLEIGRRWDLARQAL